MTDTNHLGQSVGYRVPHWTPRPRPAARELAGHWCRLEPLDPARHGEDLHRANGMDELGRMWTYLPYGPFDELGSYRGWLESVAGGEDPLFFAVVGREDGRAVGVVAFLRVNPLDGSIEVGHLAFSPALQRTTAATEAMALMMATVFDELGYRRYEWKCDALNTRSRRAALRLGFVYEGTFRQALMVKGRNRDTAWFSITDTEWPRLKAAYQRWLAPVNFDAAGRQREVLSTLTRPSPSRRRMPLAPPERLGTRRVTDRRAITGSLPSVLPEWPPDTVAILSTSGEEPHAIPVSAAVRAGPSRMLIALAAGRASLSRLRADPRVAMVILGEGDIALTAHGRARVVEETLVAGVVAVEIEVERIQSHNRAAFEIDAGVRWRWTDPQAESRDSEVRSALEQLAGRRGLLRAQRIDK